LKLINIRVPEDDDERIARIALTSGKKKSELYREAIKAFLSEYGGEPTLLGLQRRIKEIDLRLAKVEDALIKAGALSAKGAENP